MPLQDQQKFKLSSCVLSLPGRMSFIEFVNIMKQWLFKLGLWSFGLSIRKQRDSFWSRASSRLCCINKESNDFFQRITSLL